MFTRCRHRTRLDRLLHHIVTSNVTVLLFFRKAFRRCFSFQCLQFLLKFYLTRLSLESGRVFILGAKGLLFLYRCCWHRVFFKSKHHFFTTFLHIDNICILPFLRLLVVLLFSEIRMAGCLRKAIFLKLGGWSMNFILLFYTFLAPLNRYAPRLISLTFLAPRSWHNRCTIISLFVSWILQHFTFLSFWFLSISLLQLFVPDLRTLNNGCLPLIRYVNTIFFIEQITRAHI